MSKAELGPVMESRSGDGRSAALSSIRAAGLRLQTSILHARRTDLASYPTVSFREGDRPFHFDGDVIVELKLATAQLERIVERIGDDYLVTLQQVAPLVHRSKRTMERWKQSGRIPHPDVEGGGRENADY